MQPGDVALQVVEAVAGSAAGGVQVDAVQALHDVHVVGDLPLGHHGLAEALVLHVLAVVPADGHGWVDDVGDHQHTLSDLLCVLHLLLFDGGQLVLHVLHLLLGGLGLVLLALAHQRADLLGDLVALGAQVVRPLDGLAVLPVECHDLIHEDQLLVLELLLDVLPDEFGIRANQIDIQHVLLFLLELRLRMVQSMGNTILKQKSLLSLTLPGTENFRGATRLARFPGRLEPRCRGRAPPARRRTLGKWKPWIPRRRFAPATGSLNAQDPRLFPQSQCV